MHSDKNRGCHSKSCSRAATSDHVWLICTVKKLRIAAKKCFGSLRIVCFWCINNHKTPNQLKLRPIMRLRLKLHVPVSWKYVALAMKKKKRGGWCQFKWCIVGNWTCFSLSKKELPWPGWLRTFINTVPVSVYFGTVTDRKDADTDKNCKNCYHRTARSHPVCLKTRFFGPSFPGLTRPLNMAHRGNM